MVRLNFNQDCILTLILVALVGVAYLTGDNPYIMIPCALGAIVYSFRVGWKAKFGDD